MLDEGACMSKRSPAYAAYCNILKLKHIDFPQDATWICLHAWSRVREQTKPQSEKFEVDSGWRSGNWVMWTCNHKGFQLELQETLQTHLNNLREHKVRINLSTCNRMSSQVTVSEHPASIFLNNVRSSESQRLRLGMPTGLPCLFPS